MFSPMMEKINSESPALFGLTQGLVLPRSSMPSSQSTKSAHKLSKLFHPEMSPETFTTYYNRLIEYGIESFNSNDEDVEDLTEQIIIVQNLIRNLWINKTHARNFVNLMKIRKFLGELARDKMSQALVKSRKFWNYRFAKSQYNELRIWVWKYFTTVLSSQYGHYFDNVIIQDNSKQEITWEITEPICQAKRIKFE